MSFKTLFFYLYMLGFQVILKKNSDKKLFIISFIYIYMYFSSKRVYSCQKNVVSTFFEKYLMSDPSRKSASFELAPSQYGTQEEQTILIQLYRFHQRYPLIKAL